MFKPNVASWDRIVRFVLGIALVIAAFAVVSGAWGLIVAIVGAVFFVTALVGFCPLYALFRVSTRREPHSPAHNLR